MKVTVIAKLTHMKGAKEYYSIKNAETGELLGCKVGKRNAKTYIRINSWTIQSWLDINGKELRQ